MTELSPRAYGRNHVRAHGGTVQRILEAEKRASQLCVVSNDILSAVRFAEKKIVRFEDDPLAYEAEINALYIKAKKMFKLRYYRKKATIVANRIKCAAF